MRRRLALGPGLTIRYRDSRRPYYPKFVCRRWQGVRGNAIPDRQSLEVDRGNYEVGRRNFVAWSIWTILHLPFTGTSKRPAAAVQVGDAIDWIRLNSDTRAQLMKDRFHQKLTNRCCPAQVASQRQ